MLRYILLFLPVVLFADNKLHPDAPKNRPHHTLGYGILGSTYLSSDQIFVGQTGSTLNNGSVYIYSISNNEIIKDQIFPPIKGTVAYDFGHSISVDSNLMLIGAPSRAGEGVGRAYIYQKTANNKWTIIKQILPDPKIWTTDFGSSVEIQDGLILISDRYARNEDGMVYAMNLDSETGKWIEIDPIWTDQIISHGLFGQDIDIHDNQAIIGSRDGNIAIEYLFNSTARRWESNTIFSPSKLQTKGRFGFSAKLIDNKAFIGYPGFDNKGEVHVYHRNQSGWGLNQIITHKDSQEQSFFGASISVDTDQLIIGDFNGEQVYSYYLASDDLYKQNQILAPQNLPGSKFGRSIDIKSDRLIVGATYGELAYIYQRQDDSNWQILEMLSSAKGDRSITGNVSPCSAGSINNYYKEGGFAGGKFPCSGIDLHAFVSAEDLGGNELNDIWGWTDPVNGKEIALVCLTNGVSFVDVTDSSNPIALGFLPTETRSSIWRDVKVYKDHAFIVADNASNHGVQIFDLTQLRNVTSFTTFQKTAYYDKVGDVHNIAINEETGFAYAVGIGSAALDEYRCGAHIIDINDPLNPTYSGCLGDETTGRYGNGYVHDGQFIVYKGPDADYYGREIALTSNETALGIADVTDKSNLKIISKYESNNFRYIHQGWISDDHKYFYTNDELNELRGVDSYQTTIVFDITDLDNPQIANIYRSDLRTIDHNNYIIDSLMYQSNYSAGLRILDISNPIYPKEVAYFDTYPSGNKIDFVGSWSNYPYFKSKTIVVSSIEEGLYVLKLNEGEDLSIDDNTIRPKVFALEQNYPNPFNPLTNIKYTLPDNGEISLIVFNSLGQIMETLEDGYKEKGSYNISFDGSSLPSGIYFYQLRTKDSIQTRKMSLIK